MFLTSYKILLVLALSAVLCLPGTAARLRKLPSADPSKLLQDFHDKLVKEEPLNVDIKDANNLAAHEQVMLRQDDMHNKSTVSELIRRSLQVRVYHAVYNDLLLQRYDSFSDLRNSGGPNVNQEVCLNQLRHLNERLDTQLHEKYNSNDINLAQLLNTFGRASSNLHLGDGFWPGAYEECLRLKIETPEGQVPTRYCIAHIQHKSWTNQSNPLDTLTAMKSGLCVPKSCDSLNYKNKYDLIMRLMESNMRQIDRDEGDLTDLYCLPDSQSPLRTWWLQPKPVMAMVCLVSWILLQVYATLRRDAGGVYKLLSITHSVGVLLGSSGSNPKPEQTSDKESDAQSGETIGKPLIVETSRVEAIKVIAQVFIILGHVLMCLPHSISNNLEMGRTTSLLYILTNMMPAYAVNAFFGMTGLLTSYLMFRQNQSLMLMKSPVKWIGAILQRYIRIMPLYIVVVAYAKYLAKYTGSGPFWDYGTSDLAHRRNCEQESWLWTILFAANFKSPLRHCIPSAWYLANDFQFFLITPILLAALHYSPKFGKWFLRAILTASSIVCFMDIYSTHLEDLRPIANFMPHGFKLYITYLHQNYTRPENRICAYISGFMLGHSLYVLERDRFEFESGRLKLNEKQQQEGRDYIAFMKKWGIKLCVFLFTLMFVVAPIIGHQVKFGKPLARFMVSLLMARAHVNVALCACIYLIMASFGYGNVIFNRFLAAGFWKPLARLSLCVLLVNVEVIIYITQVKTHTMYLNIISHGELAIICVLGCYLTAAVLFIFFEAPLRIAIGYLMKSGLKRAAANKKKCD